MLYRRWEKKVSRGLDTCFGHRLWRMNPDVEAVIRDGHKIHLYNHPGYHPAIHATLMYYYQITGGVAGYSEALSDILASLEAGKAERIEGTIYGLITIAKETIKLNDAIEKRLDKD